ncbi:PepSY domain-containing protein [Brachybacterium paraconglomeratum]|uniref:PepSY domain-containing protein n=1 Tax=Brachybacterium paraconglomeratum TaxID=173362 RepID=UPI0022AF8A06|nr:PepSY domain-containing protein [Brachybacterium paraconglomeratum]MCZ4327125.1 PepSY domain-containing protein [Brachybacterium paraconglomeratum]
MTRTSVRPRSTVRALALGALVLGLAAGCGGDSGSDEASAVEGPGASEEESGSAASDGASDDGASDDGATGADGGEAPGAGAAALPEDADLATEQLPITAEKAVEIGLGAAGGGELVQIEIDHDDDVWEWELEIVDRGRQHDLDIDATSGEVTEHDQDDDDDQDPAVDVTSPMPYAEAIEIALGQEQGRVSGWDLSSDDGRIHYTIDIDRSGDDDVEVEVDVETGEVRVDD